MVTAENIQHYSSKYQNQRKKLEDADIDDRDRDAIKEYLDHRDANDDIGTGTLADHCNRLRLSAERADAPLVEMDEQTYDSLMVTLKRTHNCQEGTRRNYRKALRKFFEYRGTDWWDKIGVGSTPSREVDESKTLSMEEIQALIDASTHPRRSALIALLGDTGIRISAAAGLRVRDFIVDGRKADIKPNPASPNKTAQDPVPITWSRGALSNWLDAHPHADNPDAPLFIKLEHIGDDPIEERFLSYQYLSRRIKNLAEDAGIERDRVNTRNFRKSAISRWIREGLDEQKIKHRAHWVSDSGQFEAYSAVTAEEMNDDIRGHYDILPETTGVDHTLDTCPTCPTPLNGSESFCPSCGTPLSHIARETLDEVEDDAFETAANTNDADKIQKAHEFRQAFRTDPEFRRALLGDSTITE